MAAWWNGIHVRLKIECRKDCGFESHCSYVNETVVTILIVVGIVAMITDIFGLGSVWHNRGSWYMVLPEELDIVLENLYRMNAFKNVDGLDSEYVKIRVHAWGSDYNEQYYRVKVPHWVFKYEASKLDDNAKAKMLGLRIK